MDTDAKTSPSLMPKPPYCAECGVLLPIGSKFCKWCGAIIVGATEFEQTALGGATTTLADRKSVV